MKTKLLAAALACAVLCGCNDDRPKLYVYTWADYIDPELIAEFEEKNRCSVVIDTFDCNESMFAKLMAGAAGYDIVMPTEYVIGWLVQAGLIDKVDQSKLPNATKNFDRMFATPWAFEWDVPYAFSCTGILWRKDKAPADLKFDDWSDMFDERLKGRVCMMNDIREILGIAMKYNGASGNSVEQKDLDEAVETARKWKSRATKMDNEAYRTGIPSGEFVTAMAYNSDAVMILADDPDAYGYSVPTNGTMSSMDVFCVMKDSKNKELAHRFIDMFYELPNAVRNSEYNAAPMPVAGLYNALSDKYKAIPFMRVTDELKARCEDIKDVGDKLEMYSKAWDKVKAR